MHFMQALKLPKGVIRQIDRMRRAFLWKGAQECKGINCLVSWDKTCTLKKNGGLGILDLERQNEALLAKWLWRMQRYSEEQWTETMRLLHRLSNPNNWQATTQTSFFLKDLELLLPFYACSVKMEEGEVKWRWNENDFFSCSSAYRMMHDTGMVSGHQRILWKLKIPMKVKIFIWLLMDNKLRTQEILHVRGCPVDTGCKFCGSSELETRDHILWECTYPRDFWQNINIQMNL